MNIDYVQAIQNEEGITTQFKASIDGAIWFIPVGDNKQYNEIMAQVDAGTVTIDPLVPEEGE